MTIDADVQAWHFDDDVLISYLDKDLGDDLADAVEFHLQDCRQCRERASEIRERLDFFDNRFTLRHMNAADWSSLSRLTLEGLASGAGIHVDRLKNWLSKLEDVLSPADWEPRPGFAELGAAPYRIELEPGQGQAAVTITAGDPEAVELFGGSNAIAGKLIVLARVEGAVTANPVIEIAAKTDPAARFCLEPGSYLLLIEPNA